MHQQRRARLEARVSAEQKALFERAAALQGLSLTDFLVQSAQAAAWRRTWSTSVERTESVLRRSTRACAIAPPSAEQRPGAGGISTVATSSRSATDRA